MGSLFVGPAAIEDLIATEFAAAYRRNMAVCEMLADDAPIEEVRQALGEGAPRTMEWTDDRISGSEA